MRRVYQVAALGFVAMGLFAMQEARNLVYSTSLGPGPGFFPFWLGLLLVGLSIAWLVKVSLGETEAMSGDFVPSRGGVLRVISIVVALGLFGALVESVGFQLVMLLFMIFLLVALGRRSLPVTVAVSLASSFGLFYVFRNWLGVQLPYSTIDVLRNLGL